MFELSPPRTKGGKWTEKVLYAFEGVKPGKQFGDGANPNGGLVLDGMARFTARPTTVATTKKENAKAG